MKSYSSTYLTDRLIAQCLKAEKHEWARTADGLQDAILEPFCALDSHNSCFQAVQSDALPSGESDYFSLTPLAA